VQTVEAARLLGVVALARTRRTGVRRHDERLGNPNLLGDLVLDPEGGAAAVDAKALGSDPVVR
jgi:hypothetical protein